MTVWNMLSALVPFGMACYAIGAAHTFLYFTTPSRSRVRSYPPVGHPAQPSDPRNESRERMGSKARTE